MGNVKACVKLLLKWEMVVDEQEVLQWICCLCVHGGIARALGRGSVCSVAAKHQDTADSHHPGPLWWGAAVE